MQLTLMTLFANTAAEDLALQMAVLTSERYSLAGLAPLCLLVETVASTTLLHVFLACNDI